MEKIRNPYTPGAGMRPLTLAGRDEIIENVEVLLGQVKLGRAQRSMMLYGLRGVGKTVLLNEFERMAVDAGYLVEQIEIPEKDDFKVVIGLSIRNILYRISTVEKAKSLVRKAFQVLKSFSISLPGGGEFTIDLDAWTGEGDTRNFERDLVDLMLNLGNAAKEENRFVCFLIDETQYLREREFQALIAAIHRISQKNLPLLFICAGLPTIAALAGDAKSYAERLFEFVEIGSLGENQARQAIIEPARGEGVEFEAAAVKELFLLSEGYPYFIQEFGKFSWIEASESPIRFEDVQRAKQAAIASLDRSFFKVRLDRAIESEKAMMRCMAQLGAGPYSINKVAQCLGKKVNSVSPTRYSLINKGFIFSPQHGMVDFTVPKFEEFLLRHYQLGVFPI